MGIKIIGHEDGSEEEVLDMKHRLSNDCDIAISVLQYFYETREVELDGLWNKINKKVPPDSGTFHLSYLLSYISSSAFFITFASPFTSFPPAVA